MPITGSCHCGQVAFEIDGDIPPALTRCTCSICSKRGSLYADYPPAQFRLTTPPAGQASSRWNTRLMAHFFCPVCGCSTYNDSPDFKPDDSPDFKPDDSPDFKPDGSWDGETRRIGVNARLFDNFDAASTPVQVVDGKNLW